MLNCFTQMEEGAVPIIPIYEDQLANWSEQQEERVKNWVNSIGFRAKSGTFGLLCDATGKLEKVLLGMTHAKDLAVFGQLAVNLPKGHYKIAAAFDKEQYYQAFLAWGMASYQFTPFKKFPPLEAKLYLSENDVHSAYLEAVLRAIYLVRDLINTPADDMTPGDLMEAASHVAEELGGKVKHIFGDELLKAGYPTIYAVGRASQHPPGLIDLHWGNPSHPKVTLVGKGVCFDTGGLDIKNASSMALMKKDMAGAAHVLGLARIIMALKLPVNLRVLIPAVENAVSGDSYHPGDVLVTRKGLTVEVTNTDAEGRLVLSDALHEAATEKPELLLDFATLTGAARVALGTDIAALFTPDDELAASLMACGKAENDLLWRLPIHAPYRKMLDSRIADLTNSSQAPYAGAITAAVFLKEFVPDDIAWAHFDIMAWNTSSKPAAPEGGEACALRAVARYLYERFAP
ncbi:MAG TPA: leucyl aminopeptidase family protein [Gammaproteobacteria bacterium]|nr:leucyl aminopeptidase family protein [Gammaproteobacteria bacterium]